MREIKFRAWDKTLKQIILWDDMFKLFDMNAVFSGICKQKVDFEQFTGLYDDNGKEIYEGDILELTDRNNAFYSWRAVVVFGNPNNAYSWGFQLRPITKSEYNTDILLWVETDERSITCRIIGNVHENPELLEERK